jgi:predicted RNase H-like HicB family nuclease
MSLRQFTAVIRREENGYVSHCPEFDIASQGDTLEAARDNLREALELFFEYASDEEVARRAGGDIHVTQVEVSVG